MGRYRRTLAEFSNAILWITVTSAGSVLKVWFEEGSSYFLRVAVFLLDKAGAVRVASAQPGSAYLPCRRAPTSPRPPRAGLSLT